MKKLDTEEFIKRARKIHGDKYNYSKVEYINSNTKVCIICHEKDENGIEHGEFWQTPVNHLGGKAGCPKCNGGAKIDKEEFIKRAKKVHGDKYDYSKVEYINSTTEVCIICSEHGEFWQKPVSHLSGHGCCLCGKSYKSNTKEFIEKARKIHGDKYDYSKVDYVNAYTEVCIICHEKDENGIEHGEFWQKPHNHLMCNGGGCPKCNGGIRIDKEEFIKRAKKAHGDKYDYSKVEYINSNTKVCIICPEHGEFWQLPGTHITGVGCPRCTNISRLKNNVKEFLTKNNIDFEEEHTWQWLRFKSVQHVDIYLSKYNVVIECQGKQHFEACEYFDKRYKVIDRIELDNNKLNLCSEHGIKVYYYSNLSKKNKKYNYPYKVYEDLNELLEDIKKDFNDRNNPDLTN